MSYSSYNRGGYKPKKKKVSHKHIILLVIAALLVGALVWFIFGKQKAHSPSQPSEEQKIETTEAAAQPQLPNLQPVIDEFVANHPGIYAVKITDEKGSSLAVINGDKQFFTASIYKLYVAYVGYQKIDDGTYNLNDPYLSGYTRGKCLDAMIRDSYSPCAEKMWVELGKEKLTKQMEGYGLTNTSLTGLSTSANDAAIILKKISTGEGLSKESQAAYLNSMKTQDAKYRRGLPSGFKSAVVYNKVGWNLDQEWHDTAIVELVNGQKVIISVLTTGAGYQNTAALGAELEKALQ